MLLQCKDLTIKFGGLIAVNHINITIQPGEIVGLIGPNGSGKTTMFNMISGIYKPTKGQIIFAGQNIAGCKPDYITKAGIARTFQNIRLFSDMTVWENIQVGHHCRYSQSILADVFATSCKIAQEQLAQEQLLKLLEIFKMQHLQNELAKNLPYGLQRELEIVRALASDPKLLLLDEPAAGMNPQETVNLMNLILKIKDMGITILLVEHDMKLVMNICKYLHVLNYGKKIAEGTPREIQNNDEVIKAYLGKQVKPSA